MNYTSQKFQITQPYMLDTAMRGYILNGCWLLAAAGTSIAQMLLLAQAWHQDQHAARIACLTFGLVIVWCYPNWSDPVKLFCLLPLLSLDLLTSSFNPRISWTGMTRTLFAQRADPARWLPLRLERQPKMAGWWRTYLVHRGYAVHTLLATGTAILMGAVWSAIPTPFAGVLAETGEINKLISLLAGQVGALAIGTWLLTRCRNLVGAPDRLVPP